MDQQEALRFIHQNAEVGFRHLNSGYGIELTSLASHPLTLTLKT